MLWQPLGFTFPGSPPHGPIWNSGHKHVMWSWYVLWKCPHVAWSYHCSLGSVWPALSLSVLCRVHSRWPGPWAMICLFLQVWLRTPLWVSSSTPPALPSIHTHTPHISHQPVCPSSSERRPPPFSNTSHWTSAKNTQWVNTKSFIPVVADSLICVQRGFNSKTGLSVLLLKALCAM